MSQEVVIAQSVQAVSTALGEVLKTYQLSRTVRRAEVVALREKVTEARAAAGAHARGRLIRTNLEELIETQRLIDSEGLRGDALTYAMEQLRLLNIELKRNFEAFARG
ncbi:hypothetical protein [Terrabacter sp. C0L_2]|uniref:hypothetical protein n=1 Tax=Terrabacter sp. C0L_2 TaxID=3108389 RepID=UPI002ED0169D|nr:hypothetical protein U5C87_00680 [Terrabacter sp. C0L_2]